MFPETRLRRTRRADWVRRLVAENSVSPADLVWPVFVVEGKSVRAPIKSMPGVFRFSVDELVKEAKAAAALGIPAIALFSVIEQKLKDKSGTEALNKNNLVCRAIKAVKDKVPNIGVICDVALDPYTSHGHDGIVESSDVANDKTVDVLCQQAIVQASAGCDIVAPSDMMDGRIGAIRGALDAEGFQNVMILSYAVKYASSFYGPFRNAIGSDKNLGKADKKTYQMNPANSDEAMREAELDIEEGADMIMVKPGMPYLDIIRRLKDNFEIPIFAYQVSGEYSMLRLAADSGFMDWDAVIMESLISFKRAGATGIFTYAATQVAKSLQK